MKIKVTIEGNIENNSYSTLWVQPNQYWSLIATPTNSLFWNLQAKKAQIWVKIKVWNEQKIKVVYLYEYKQNSFLNLTPTNKNTFFWFLEAKNVQNFV